MPFWQPTQGSFQTWCRRHWQRTRGNRRSRCRRERDQARPSESAPCRPEPDGQDQAEPESEEQAYCATDDEGEARRNDGTVSTQFVPAAVPGSTASMMMQQQQCWCYVLVNGQGWQAFPLYNYLPAFNPLQGVGSFQGGPGSGLWAPLLVPTNNGQCVLQQPTS